VLLALGPLLVQGATLARVTVLAAGDDAVLVVQDRRSALLVNSGTDRTGFYTVSPFLRQGGINRLAGAVHGNDDDSDGDSWRAIAEKIAIGNFYRPDSALAIALPVGNFHRLTPNAPHRLGRLGIEYLADGERGLRLRLLGNHPWLLLPDLSPDRQIPWLQAHPGLTAEVLWWHGEPLTEALVNALGMTTAIASGRAIDPNTEALLRDRGIKVFCTERDGAVSWSPGRGFWGFLGDRPSAIASLE
jgi:competence protein ComEC